MAKSLRTRALVALLVVLNVMCYMSPAAATIPWLSFFNKGMGLKGAKSYSAQAFSQPSAASASSSPSGGSGAFVDLLLGADVLGRPVEMTVDKPAAFPIAVANMGDTDLELTFSVIDTPGPDGESVASLEVLGIRAENGLPAPGDARKLSVPAGATVDAEIALLSRSSDLEGRAPSAVTTTGATITAEDEASGRTQFTRDPIELRITDPRAAAPPRDGGPQSWDTQARAGGGGGRRCVELSEVLRTNGHTDTFAEIWEATNLNDTLPGDARFAVLAPTDAAFDQLTATLGISKADLMSSPSLDLLLLHHVLPQRISVDALAALDGVETATCDQIEVGVRDMAVTVSGCEVSASDVEVCNVDLYKLNCVLPPPMMEHGHDLCLPAGPTAQVISRQHVSGKNGPPGDSGSSTAVDDYYDYDYDYDFDLPPGFPAPGQGQDSRPSRFGVVAASGPEAGGSGSGSGGDALGDPETWEWEPLETKVALRPVPDKWTRLNHLAHAGEAPVKATFLPPGWKEWITPGDLRCPREDAVLSSAECARAPSSSGRSCASPGTLHTCGFLESAGPKSYQIQPPPEAFREGFIEMGGGTYVWQSVEGGSSYCTPATEDGSSFRGSVYHEAWVEPRKAGSGGGDLDAMLFLLQNPLDGSPWQVVSMQTAPAPGTRSAKRLRTAGQGCFLWVVASATGSGEYDFHLHVSERL